jgi:N-acetylglucosaminyldiphosphoundecaprenol N-acetyl-beta-D-mannosaminyltransferase
MIRRIELIGLPVTVFPTRDDCLAHVLPLIGTGERGVFASFINPRSYYLAKHDPAYSAALANLDLVLPDGIGIVWALRYLAGVRAARVSFDATSLYHPVFRHLQGVRCPVFIIGGRPGIAEKAAECMQTVYPKLNLVGVMHGYLSRANSVRAIKASGARFVLCGMGAPNQEAMLMALKHGGFCGSAFSCGGFLDQLVEKKEYYPRWVDRLEVRCLYRLVREPRRLCRRYLYEYQTFVRQFLRSVLTRAPRGAKTDGLP